MLTNPVLCSMLSDECIELGLHYITFESSIRLCMKLQPNKDIDYTQQWSIHSNSLNSKASTKQQSRDFMAKFNVKENLSGAILKVKMLSGRYPRNVIMGLEKFKLTIK